jgi:hypothetical protein
MLINNKNLFNMTGLKFSSQNQIKISNPFEPFIRPGQGRDVPLGIPREQSSYYQKFYALPSCSSSPMVVEVFMYLFVTIPVCYFAVLNCCPSRKQGMALGCNYGFYAKRNLQICAWNN